MRPNSAIRVPDLPHIVVVGDVGDDVNRTTAVTANPVACRPEIGFVACGEHNACAATSGTLRRD